MNGIVGRRPFKDYSIPGSNASEYGDDDAAPSWGGRAPDPSAFERLGTNLLDRLRATTGMPTSVEIGEAGRIKDEAHSSRRYDQRSAAAVADRLSLHGDDVVRKALPMIEGPIPRQEDMRWAAIATTAIDVLHAHVDHGDDQRLSPELGRANRLDTVVGLRSTHYEGSLDNALVGMSEEGSNRIRNYLSRDPSIDAMAKESHDRMVSRGMNPVRTPEMDMDERAQARAGLVAPDTLVERAVRFTLENGIPPGYRANGPVHMPDFGNLNAQGQQREALLQREKTLSAEAAAGPAATRTPSPPIKDREIRDVTADIRALQAARAASMDRQGGR